jgi:hypothetical protein
MLRFSNVLLSYREIIVEVVKSSVAACRFVSHCEASPRLVKGLDEA